MNEPLFLEELFELVKARQQLQPAGSYTVKLLNQPELAAQKVGEEAVEVIVAALAQSPDRLISEAADLLYHLLVLLCASGVTLQAVDDHLRARHTASDR